MLEYEKKCLAAGCRLVAGIDEAGRGPLAGPVSCAAVILPLDELIDGVNDSKKLTAKKRDELYDKIIERAVAYRIVMIDEGVIDEVNILNATKQGMTEAAEGLAVRPDVVLVDAVNLKLSAPSVGIVHGDALSYSIAAASILAKVARDRLMEEYDAPYPQYGFARHKGYGTKYHYEQIRRYGLCPIHRRSFLKNIVL